MGSQVSDIKSGLVFLLSVYVTSLTCVSVTLSVVHAEAARENICYT